MANNTDIYFKTFRLNQYTWWRHQMETFSALLAFSAGNSPVTIEFPSQRPVTRSFDIFFDLRLNQQLSKQWRRRRFETPSRSFWRHCNATKQIEISTDMATSEVWLYLIPSRLLDTTVANQLISHYLDQCWPNSLTHICGTRGRWVDKMYTSKCYYYRMTYKLHMY